MTAARSQVSACLHTGLRSDLHVIQPGVICILHDCLDDVQVSPASSMASELLGISCPGLLHFLATTEGPHPDS